MQGGAAASRSAGLPRAGTRARHQVRVPRRPVRVGLAVACARGERRPYRVSACRCAGRYAEATCGRARTAVSRRGVAPADTGRLPPALHLRFVGEDGRRRGAALSPQAARARARAVRASGITSPLSSACILCSVHILSTHVFEPAAAGVALAARVSRERERAQLSLGARFAHGRKAQGLGVPAARRWPEHAQHAPPRRTPPPPTRRRPAASPAVSSYPPPPLRASRDSTPHAHTESRPGGALGRSRQRQRRTAAAEKTSSSQLYARTRTFERVGHP